MGGWDIKFGKVSFDKTDSQLANFNLEKVKVVVNIFAWNDRFRRENRECEVFWNLVRSFEPDWPNVERYKVKLLYLERTQHHNPFF